VKYLLDTHTFLWWISDNPALSQKAREIISDSANDIYLGAGSVWELAIKTRAGKLALDGELESFVGKHLQSNSFQMLPITLPHAAKVQKLPNKHRDPFDQMLAAQSLVEGMPLISKDQIIAGFGAEVVW